MIDCSLKANIYQEFSYKMEVSSRSEGDTQMNIGLIGAGAIAHFLLHQLDDNKQGSLQIKSVYVRNKEKYEALEQQFGIILYTDLEAFLASNIDIVVEAATIEAVRAFVPTILKQKPVVLISIGALADEQLLQYLYEIAIEYNQKLYLPSGAIGGLDLLQNAHALGTITSVSLITRKPAQSLIDEKIEIAQTIFEGTARDAIRKFPKNMNVSIVLALASIGFDATTVKLVADPQIDQNIHQVDISGDFGEAMLTIKNNPLQQNPKTSYLAAMSILGTLKRMNQKLIIGG